MKRIIIDLDAELSEQLEPAAEALREGEVVAFPTETVYGLGADALNADALCKIFEAKQRPSTNPLIAHVASWPMVHSMVEHWPALAQRLAQAFWPGPLTLIVQRSALVPDVLTAGLPHVALRWPAHPVAQALIAQVGHPLAAPSANRHMHTSPTQAEHVMSSLHGRIQWVVDAGPTQVGIESTIVRVEGDHLSVLRSGHITKRDLLDALGPEITLSDHTSLVVEGSATQAPGQSARHYAPNARVKMVRGSAHELAALAQGREGIVLIARGPTLQSDVSTPWGWTFVLPDDPVGYGVHLYRVLHRTDELNAQEVWIEAPPESEAWAAIWDRLNRAIA